MSATITTPQHRRVPLATALAIAGFLVAGGALGFAWEQSQDSPAPAEAPALTAPTAQDYSQYNYYHGPNAGVAEPKTHTGQAAEVPNATIAEQQQSTTQAPPSDVPNAQVAEQQQNTFQPPSGGRVQLGN